MGEARKPLSKEERAEQQVKNLRDVFVYMRKATNLKIMLLQFVKEEADAARALGFEYDSMAFCASLNNHFIEAKTRVDIHELPFHLPEPLHPKEAEAQPQ